ncbi:hypothetical protein ACFY4C_33945 [Actinomadura viridis]
MNTRLIVHTGDDDDDDCPKGGGHEYDFANGVTSCTKCHATF